MTTTITIKEPLTIDEICWRHYGQTQGMTEQVLNANPGLSNQPLWLAAGTIINLPAVKTTPIAQARIQLWD